MVKILSGDDKGQTGKVLKVDVKNYRAYVEGKNMHTKHAKPSAKNPQGGMVKQEGSIHISNLMLVDAKGNATRIGRRMGENGKLVR
jgi:large subunit ribosomal protein L24